MCNIWSGFNNAKMLHRKNVTKTSFSISWLFNWHIAAIVSYTLTALSKSLSQVFKTFLSNKRSHKALHLHAQAATAQSIYDWELFQWDSGRSFHGFDKFCKRLDFFCMSWMLVIFCKNIIFHILLCSNSFFRRCWLCMQIGTQRSGSVVVWMFFTLDHGNCSNRYPEKLRA